MSGINMVPLGDGQQFDLGYTSPNQFGVVIDFYTDPWTGADPFRASIPNPPLVYQIPDSWGLETVCWTGCGGPGQEPNPQPTPVPEPEHWMIVAIALVAILVFRHVYIKRVGK